MVLKNVFGAHLQPPSRKRSPVSGMQSDPPADIPGQVDHILGDRFSKSRAIMTSAWKKLQILYELLGG